MPKALRPMGVEPNGPDPPGVIMPGVMEGVWGVEDVMAQEDVAVAPGVRVAGVSSQRLRRLEADGVGVSWMRSEAARSVLGVSTQPLGEQIYRLFNMKYTNLNALMLYRTLVISNMALRILVIPFVAQSLAAVRVRRPSGSCRR